MRNTLGKHERLCQQRLIERLFREGNRVTVNSFRARWLVLPISNSSPVQVLFSVPKSLFPQSHDRNLLKRRMKEAYRKNKHLLYTVLDSSGTLMILSITYASSQILTSKEIQEKIIVLLQRLIKKNEKASG